MVSASVVDRSGQPFYSYAANGRLPTSEPKHRRNALILEAREFTVNNTPAGPYLLKPVKLRLPRLALRGRQAAEALGISERLLSQWVRESDIPHVRVAGGRAVIFPVDALRAWLAKQVQSTRQPTAEVPNGTE